jgi:hypothetical protein
MSLTQKIVESPYYTPAEAAVYLPRPSVQSIYALVKRGRLKPMPGFGRLLFTKEELDACLQRKRR